MADRRSKHYPHLQSTASLAKPALMAVELASMVVELPIAVMEDALMAFAPSYGLQSYYSRSITSVPFVQSKKQTLPSG